MTASTTDGRHLSRESLQHYMAAGAPAIVKIEGSPIAYLVIEPAGCCLALRVPHARNTLPDLSAYQHIAGAIIHWDGSLWCQIAVSGPLTLDAYPLLLAIADRVQIDNMEFARASRSALDAFRDLLLGAPRLSDERRTGLFGELLVLRHLATSTTPAAAVAAWRGPDAEEHDFDIGVADLEVKSTTNELRRHWIDGLTQLTPTLGRPLWFMSVQLTAGIGTDACTLGELISEIESGLPSPSVDDFTRKLRAAGWRDEHRSDGEHLRLRSAPAVYSVDASFPCLTRRELSGAGLIGERLVQLSYAIDITTLPASPHAPAVIADIGR